ncbi:spondin domain-containing protein [Candidatus Omnitrophota bacterium]
MLKKLNLIFIVIMVMFSGCIFNNNNEVLYTISGSVVSEINEGIPDVTISAGNQTTTTDASGYYSIDLEQGTYTIVPSKTNFTFLPESKEITVTLDVMVDFTGIDQSLASITITNPSSGDLLSTGEAITIYWDANALVSGKYDILLYYNGANLLVITSDYSQSTSYPWTLPSNIIERSNYSIRVQDANDNTVYDEVTNIHINSEYVPDETAKYTIIFSSTWSKDTHPLDFPSSAHFSGLIGAVHNEDVILWQEGSLASAGIQQVAEVGRNALLVEEINPYLENDDAYALLYSGGISTSPGSVSLNFTAHIDYTKVTLVSMVAPSPDWFVGVSGLNLFQNDDWVIEKEVELYVYDAGTDAGETFVAANQPIESPEKIKLLNEYAFSNNGTAIPAGYFTFKKQ